MVKALIAVRSGSQRVPDKNIRPFAGSNLLEIKIKQLLKVKNLDGVIVNSDDEKMLGMASKLGVEVVEREPYFASNIVSMSEVYQNMAEHANADIIAYTNVTSPLVKTETIEAMIDFFLNQSSHDSLNSAHAVKEFMFLDGKPINYSLDKQPRSQDLPDIFAINFAVSLISRDNMVLYKNIVGKKPHLYPISEIESVDIDTVIDFEIAEFLFQKYGNGR